MDRPLPVVVVCKGDAECECGWTAKLTWDDHHVLWEHMCERHGGVVPLVVLGSS